MIVDDALPAGLEVVDLGLRTSAGIAMLDASRRLPAGSAVADSDPWSPWGQLCLRPPAHAEEMYNRGVHGRSDGGTFIVRER